MATEVVKTLRASGGDYSTFNSWVLGEKRDIQAVDEIAVCEIYHDWPSGLSTRSPEAILQSEWNTDSTHPVILRAAPGHRHNGRPFNSGGQYTGANLCVSGSGSYNLTTYFLRVEGLILHQTSATSSPRHIMTSSIGTSGTKPANLLVFDGVLGGVESTYASTSTVFRVQNRRDVAYVNCVAWKGAIGFSCGGHAQANAWILNCTSLASYQGYVQGNSSAGVQAVNSLASGASNACFSGITNATYCAATDTSLPADTGNRNSQTFSFEDAGAYDFRLKVDDTGALGHGTDLSAHAVYPFNWDALGLTRGATWDIGAFKAVLGDPPTGEPEISLVTITPDGIVLDVDDSGVSDGEWFEYQLGTVGVWTELEDSTVTGLNPTTNYQVRVAAANEHGRGDPSNLISFRTLADIAVYDKQDFEADDDTIVGDPITLPDGVTQARTYAIHRAPDGTWAIHALHEDWDSTQEEDSDSILLDLKVNVSASAETSADLKATISDAGTKALDLKAIIQSDTATPLDLKAVIRSADASQFDCLVAVAVAGEGVAFADLKTIVKSAEAKSIDLLASIANVQAEVFDLKAVIIDSDSVPLDLKTRVRSVQMTALDLLAILGTEVTASVDLMATIAAGGGESIDLKVGISDTAHDALDLRARIASVISDEFDLSATLAFTPENTFDLKVTIGDDGETYLDLKAALLGITFIEGNKMRVKAQRRPYRVKALRRGLLS